MFQRLSIALIVAVLLPGSMDAQMIVTDGELLDSNWEHEGFGTGPRAGSGFFTAGTNSANLPTQAALIEGNPGVYRYFSHSYGGRQNGTVRMWSMEINTTYEHDPSLEALDEFDISFDGFRVNGSDNQGGPSDVLFFGAAVSQGMNLFLSEATPLSTFETWTHLEYNRLKQSDFTYLGNLPTIPVLDFSAAGEKITFGMYGMTTNNFTTRGRGGFDNYRLAVNPISPVPEPSTFTLTLLATLGLSLYRLRGQRAA